MISTRILDNDMGAVMKVPLTGRGTIHGVTIELDIVVAQEKDMNGKFVDITNKITLTELDVGLLEIISADRGVPRFAEHAKQLNNPEREKLFVDAYTKWVTGGKK
jgi:hypothetical protein